MKQSHIFDVNVNLPQIENPECYKKPRPPIRIIILNKIAHKMVESSQFTVALHIPATKKVSDEAIVYFPDTNATPADVYKFFSTRMTDLKVARLEEAPLAHIMMKNAGVKGFEPKNRTWDSTDTDVFKQG